VVRHPRHPRQFRLTVSSVGLYQTEKHALDVATLLFPRLVPASYAMLGLPDLTAILWQNPVDRWRARVSS